VIDGDEQRRHLCIARDRLKIRSKPGESCGVVGVLGAEHETTEAALADHRLDRRRDLRAVERDAHQLADLLFRRERRDDLRRFLRDCRVRPSRRRTYRGFFDRARG